MWKKHKYLALAAILLATIVPRSYADEPKADEPKADEGALLAVLRSDAPLEEKSAACRQLTRIATKESVSTLATLLSDAKLSHMARYALEPIKDPSVDDALRNALGKLEGRPRLGVIGSLGMRRDSKAVNALAKLLNGSDAARAAARALGNIGTLEAADALEGALLNASGDERRGICQGLLRCAEALAAEGEPARSQAIYDRVRALSDVPPYIHAAALRGAILTRGDEGVPLLVEAIRGSNYALAAIAARTAMEASSPAVADALVAELPKATAERQGLIMLALADRGDSRMLPTVLSMAQGGDEQLRILAFRALKRVGDASCVPALLDAAVEGGEDVAKAAMESLESLQDNSVDKQLVEQLGKAKGKMRLVLLDLVGRRRTSAATDALWKAADDVDPAVRIAALTSLGALLEPSHLSKLVARLATTDNDQEAGALDGAIRAVSLRSEDREAAAAQIAAVLPKVDQPVKARVLDTLNIVGGQTAMDTVAAGARSEVEPLRDAAYRVLGQWKSADAAPILLKLHNSENDGRLKIRAIRGYIRIARQFDMPAETRAAMCRTALHVAERDADKRLVLEVLLRYPSDEMHDIAMEASENPALKEQALLVVMGMASKGIRRADLGKALAQAGQTPVKLEIIKAEYGAGAKVKDVTDILRKYAKNYRIIFLPSSSYNQSLGGDPASGIVKQLKIQYRINGKEGEVSLSENATIVLPMPE